MSDGSQEAEFDVVARWTVESVGRLGADVAIPAACRGSGGPGAIDWLADWLIELPGCRFVDIGAGLGGPAARLVERQGGQAVLSDPMAGAVEGSRSLFGWPAVRAKAQQLPFADASVDAAWALGVLSTTEDQGQVMAELRRVLVPGGRAGLVVYVATGDTVADAPAGNHFPSAAELAELIDGTGFDVVEGIDVGDLPGPSPRWTDAEDRVEADMRARHGDDERWSSAQAGEDRVGELLGEGQIVGRAYRLSAEPRSAHAGGGVASRELRATATACQTSGSKPMARCVLCTSTLRTPGVRSTA